MRNFIQNLKNLKSLTQIFRHLNNLSKANLVNLVNFVMQFFHTSHCATVSVIAVGQPTNRQDISNLSPTTSPAKVAVKSRITSIMPALYHVITPMLFVAFGLFGVNEAAWGVSQTKLTVKISGSGQIKLNNSSSQPDSWSSKELSKSTYHGGFAVRETDTYYIWINPSDGYYCSGVSGATWNNGGYYTRSIEGRTWEVSETSTATFVGNSYTLTFAGNGNTSGSMTNQSFVYGTAQNIKANGFTRAYTVDYNTDGGTLTATLTNSNTKATYNFVGWKSSNGTSYSDKAKISTFSPTPTHNTTVTLTAQWTSKSVTLPNATKSGYVLDGWYNGDTKVGEAGGSYTPTANVTLKAKWIDKHTPVMTGANTSMMVDGVQEDAFTFNHVDGQVPHIIVKSYTGVHNGDQVISYANNKIYAHNAGVAEIYFTQAETSTIKAGTSATYTYTVYKYNSAFDDVADMSTKVDANVSSDYTLNYSKPNAAYIGSNPTAGTPTEGVSSTGFYYTLEQNVTTANTENSADGSLAITYNAGNKTATGKNAGTGTIHLRQPETYKYNPASADIEVEVTKNDPVFTWKNGPYYHNSSVSNVFTSTNKDLAYTIGASTDSEVARESDNTLYILTKAGTAKFTVSQPENYKWNSKSVTYSVIPENPSNHVTFTYTQEMYNDGSITIAKVSSKGTAWDGGKLRLGGSDTGIGIGSPAYDYDDKYVDIAFKGIPEKVTFEIATNANAATGEDWYVKESSDGKNWSGEKWSSEHEGESFASFSVPLSQTARYIRLCYSGNFAGYFRNIKVYELKSFTPNPSSLDFGTHPINETCASQNFTFNYANVGHNVTLATNDSHFTVTPTNITNIGGEKVGSTTVTVSYTTADAHKSNNAKVTISDELGNTATVSLSGETKKLEPTITWSPDEATFNVDDELTAVNANELEVTLSVEAADEAYVHCEGNKATMIGAKAGTVVVTAHVTGNSIYNDKDFTKEISITNLTKQYITWEQDFSRLKTTDGTKSITLNATASSGLPVTYELVGDKTGLSLTQNGNTWTLTYLASECKNTTIVAKQGGDATYAPASSVSLPVKVIDPTKVCDMNETLVNSTVTLKNTSTYYNIDIPSTMTISVKRTLTDWWRIYTNGFKVEIYSGRNATGTKLHEYSYDEDDINTSMTKTLKDLNIAAKSVKLISNASNGYDVTSLTYTKYKKCDLSKSSLSFETYPNTVTMPQTVDVSYANYPITVECSNDKFSFDPKDFGDCSEYGTQTITVTYAAGASAGEDVGYLYIKDNTGVTLRTCTLSVTIHPKVDQSITSHNISSSYKTTDKVTLTATTNSGLTNFSYSAAPAGVAVINGAEMTFTQSGTIAVTVSEPGSAIYNAASAKVENIVVSKDVPNIPTVPTGTAVTYLQQLSSSTLSGGEADITLRDVEHTPVVGAFAWTDQEYIINENAGAHKYGVTFTPENGGMYTNATCQVEILVNRAPQAIAMKDSTVLVSVDGIDAGKADSKLDLNSLIVSQTTDPYAANRSGAVTYEVISENKANATISDVTTFSATAIGDYTIRATKAQTDYYNEATAEFTVTVGKRANTLITAGPYTKYVDEEVENAATVVNSDGEIHTSSTYPTIAYYDVENNKIVIPNSEAKSFDQTEVTIKIWQDGTDRFEGIAEADAKTITLTVKKYDNPFACSWGKWSYTANFEDVVQVEFTTANSDYEHSPIVIEQTSGENVATLVNNDATHNTITASYVRDNATWHLSQAESYKYKAGSHDVTMQVRTLSTTCYIFEDNTEHTFATEIDFTGHYDDAIAISGPAKQITFDAKMSGGLALNYFVAQYSVDNESSWRDIVMPDLTSSYETYGPYDFPGLQASERVTHIRFGAKTGATYSKWYKNIKVSRVTNIKPLDKDDNLITSMTMPQNTVGGSTTEKFYMKFSTCDDVVKLASNNPHFTLDKVEIENDPSQDAVNAEVTVTYSSNELGTHNGVITLYTKYQNRTFTVSGTTAKKVQTIDWKEGFTGDQLTLQVGLEVNNTNIAATASSGKSVIYTTDNESVIEIILNGLGFRIIGEGSATLTASEAGDGYWESVSETKSIIATNQQVQTILWDQDLVNDMTIGQEVVLDAKVYIRDANGDLTYNADRTAVISYSCPENDVISLVGKTITIQNYGQTTITATVAGTNSYAEAQPVSMTVLVREPSAICETPLVLDHSENVRLYSTKFIAAGLKYTTPEVACQIELSPSQGKPDKLSYKHNGEEASIPVFGSIKLCNGTVKVQERVNGHWDDVEGSSFNNNGEYGAYNWRDVIDLQLNENADAIRFVREEHGSGAHNFKDIKITLRQYIRPVQAVIEAGNVLDIGNIEIGEARNALVQFDYSDVKGDIIVSKGNTEDAVLELNEKKVVLECGSHGQYDLPVTLQPMEEGEWSNTITLTDNQTNASTTITIKATVILGERYVFVGDKSETGNQWGSEDNWVGSNKPGDNANVIIQSDVEIAGDVSVKSMTISEGATVTVTVTGKLTIGDGNSFMQTSYGDLHIAKGGSITMGTGTVMVRDFILDASLGNKVDENESSAVSGQFSDENNSMIMNGAAYFDLTFDPEGRISYGWYDFTVPFPVNVNGGIARINSNNDQVLENNTDFIVMEFDEQSRANGGKGWRRLYNGVMQPGKLYSITFDDEVDQNTFRFTWNGKGSKFNGESYAAKCTNGTADASLSGWNGLGNGMLSYGYLGKDGYKLQAFNHTLNKYELVKGEKTFAVGTAFFVQVDHNESIDWVPVEAETKSRPLFAPKYKANETEEFLLTLHGAGAKSEDALYFSASEEATEAYVIGHDLLKMGTPTEARVAQMWTTKGGHVLCDVEAALNGNTAYTPLMFFAPKEGNYKLAVEKAPEDADLFLTYKGNVIWNLSSGPYAFKLTKGTTEDYGLRIEARTEQVTPGNNNGALGEEAGRKVLINNMLYIVSPEGKIYDATGKSVQ